MSYAINGAAIISGNIVPASEVLVLRALTNIGKPSTVPEIAMYMNEVLSDASLYTLLGRLDKKRGLVSREEAILEVHGRPVRRVLWQAHQAAITFFRKEDKQNADICVKPAEVPG